MSLDGLTVAVAGGGIGGLAAALALSRRGAAVTVVERAPTLGEVGAGLQLAPNGVAVIEALGLGARIAGRVTQPQEIELREHQAGTLVARVPLGATARARYGHPYWHIHRADLLAILAEAVIGAGVQMRLGTAVTGPQDPALAGADVVVGADGVRSNLRTAAFAGGPARFTGHVAWRGLVPAERLPRELARPAVRTWMGPGRHLVSYPLRGGNLVNFVAVEKRASRMDEGWSRRGDPAELARAFAGFGGDAAALVEAVTECHLWGLFDHPALRVWTDGRMALLGDACHPMLPFLAQGATMALEDAWVLAASLDAAPDPAAGLAAYERARLPRATRVQAASARNARLYHLGRVVRTPVHLGLRAASAVAPELLLGRFDWVFGHDVTAAG
jgi:salicylate hydroxylase